MKYKLKQWKKELNGLTEETGVSLEDICEYLGVSYERYTGFYVKLPMKRSTYIGIGMALGRSLSEINRWITYYGTKRRLYNKDISEDLVWIYLINRSLADRGSGINYYMMYDKCQELAFETYFTLWSDIMESSNDTADIDRKLEMIEYGDVLSDLKEFVVENVDSFKTAYAKPRKLLKKYVSCILETNGKASAKGKPDSLISLRGWLDDSMINYIAGSDETIHTVNMKTGVRTLDIKRVPKNRNAHIALAMALGMACPEINEYLELMGYYPLDEESEDEKYLIDAVNSWDENHPLQKEYKEKYIYGNSSVEMNDDDESQAVNDMLMLRQELRDEYRKRGKEFPYLK